MASMDPHSAASEGGKGLRQLRMASSVLYTASQPLLDGQASNDLIPFFVLHVTRGIRSYPKVQSEGPSPERIPSLPASASSNVNPWNVVSLFI